MASPPTLLTLPPELRNQIYDLVLNDTPNPAPLCPFAFHCTPPSGPRTPYSLTQTCRQIRSETLPMWHSTRILTLALRHDNIPHYVAFLRRRPAEAFAAIRQVRLEDYQHAKVTGHRGHRFFCRSAIVINFGTGKSEVVGWRRDRRCLDCPRGRERAAERVRAVVGGRGGGGLTRERLEEVLEAAGWAVEEGVVEG